MLRRFLFALLFALCPISIFPPCAGRCPGILPDHRPRRRVSDNVYIWHYVTNFGHYWAPNPNFSCLDSYVKFYRDVGVKGVMGQANIQDWPGEFAQLRAWMLVDQKTGLALVNRFGPDAALHSRFRVRRWPEWGLVGLAFDGAVEGPTPPVLNPVDSMSLEHSCELLRDYKGL